MNIIIEKAMTNKERAVLKYETEIDAQYKIYKKKPKEELNEIARRLNVYTDNGANHKTWIAYDIAVRLCTGY